MKGRWHSDHFKNQNPITLELGCGKGEYTLALATKCPEQNFIGIDLKGARLWKGARAALDNGLPNAAFLRIPIERLEEFFATGEVSQIWIPFPDPFPRKGKAKKRLTSPRFLKIYRQILKPDGAIHLKTDDPGLFAFTLETLDREGCHILDRIEDLHGSPVSNETTAIKTGYEQKHLLAGKTIKYVRFSL